MRVLKFGGTSLATAARRDTVADLVSTAARCDGDVVVVVSALAGVTDTLVTAIEAACQGRLQTDLLAQELERRHLDGFDAEMVDLESATRERIRALCTLLDGMGRHPPLEPAVREQILATGERLAMPLLTAALLRRGLDVRMVDGTQLIGTGPRNGTAPAVDLDATRQRTQVFWTSFSNHRDGTNGSGRVVVVTGFVGSDPEGRTTTLGRGASDLTATLLAGVLDADAVEIWTDVDGVLSAPPALVPEATALGRLSYAEAAALARFGARVLHPKTLEPLAGRGIPVFVRNTLRPHVPGTRIDGDADDVALEGGDTVRAITVVEDGAHLLLRLGASWESVSTRVMACLGEHGIEALRWTRGAVDGELSLVVRAADADRAEAALRGMTAAAIERRDGVGLVAALRAPHVRPAEVAGELAATLDRARLATLAPAGPCLSDRNGHGDELAVSAVVHGDDTVPALSLLHDTLVLRRRHAAVGC